MSVGHAAIEVVALGVIALSLIQVAIQLMELAIAAHTLRTSPGEPDSDLVWRRCADETPPVSILAPAFNEQTTIVTSVKALLSLRYPEFEIIVVNDGSNDNTMEVLQQAFELQRSDRTFDNQLHHQPLRGVYSTQLHPNLLVLDKSNGGKADALNAGINAARFPLFCSVDADSLLDTDALLRAAQPFIEDPQSVVATGGTVSVANGCQVEDGRVVRVALPTNRLALLQAVEYVRAFQLARLAWSRLDALAIISGAFGLFRRNAVIEAGGYRHDTVGEDIELVVRLHRRSLEQGRHDRIVFVPEPTCWTEVPETLATLSRQRRRWQRGALETLSIHRTMLLGSKYGRVGKLALGRVVLVDLLGPIAELIGWVLLPVFWALGLLSPEFPLAFFAISFGLGVAVSTAALALQEAELSRAPRIKDLFVLGASAVVENFGYRQLNALWRVQGLLDWLRGEKRWGAMPRRGLRSAATSTK